MLGSDFGSLEHSDCCEFNIFVFLMFYQPLCFQILERLVSYILVITDTPIRRNVIVILHAELEQNAMDALIKLVIISDWSYNQSLTSVSVPLLATGDMVDGGYVNSELQVNSQAEHQVELVGRVKADIHWQTKDEHAYSIDTFVIDWEAKTVTCPQGQTTKYWKPAKDANRNDIIVIRFSRPGCRDCESRSRCTRAKKESRSLTLRPQAQHEAIQKARKEQKTPQWKERYNKRAGIEGTISQGVRGFGLRQARYIGLAKTHLQNTLTAAAINIARIDDWLTGTPLAKTRTSRFKAMEARAA